MAFGYGSCCDVIICILYCYEILIYTYSAEGTFYGNMLKHLITALLTGWDIHTSSFSDLQTANML